MEKAERAEASSATKLSRWHHEETPRARRLPGHFRSRMRDREFGDSERQALAHEEYRYYPESSIPSF